MSKNKVGAPLGNQNKKGKLKPEEQKLCKSIRGACTKEEKNRIKYYCTLNGITESEYIRKQCIEPLNKELTNSKGEILNL